MPGGSLIRRFGLQLVVVLVVAGTIGSVAAAQHRQSRPLAASHNVRSPANLNNPGPIVASSSAPVFVVVGQSNAIFLAPYIEADAPPGSTVIRCTVGATAIDRWVPGADLYSWCLGLVQQSHLHLSGLFFYQGESDSLTVSLAAAWPQKFRLFVDGVRSQFTGLPIVFAQLGTFDEPGWQLLKTEQGLFRMPRVAMVRTDDQPQQPGSQHFTDAGYWVIAGRFIAAWRGLETP